MLLNPLHQCSLVTETKLYFAQILFFLLYKYAQTIDLFIKNLNLVFSKVTALTLYFKIIVCLPQSLILLSHFLNNAVELVKFRRNFSKFSLILKKLLFRSFILRLCTARVISKSLNLCWKKNDLLFIIKAFHLIS